jgi:alanine racemase
VKLRIDEIIKIVKGKLFGSGKGNISQILTDSRSYCLPGKTAFFALKGPFHNGHDFIQQLKTKGVNCFIVSEKPTGKTIGDEISFILVEDTLTALHRVASYSRQLFKKPLVSITGSNGKTIIKEWLSQILSIERKVVRSPKSYNSQIGVPLSLWLLDNNFDFGIIEAGISQPGEMGKLEQMIQPDIGIISNIGEAHQENFINTEEKLREKLRLFKNTGTLIYCRDHLIIHQMIKVECQHQKKRIINWSFKGNANLIVHSVESLRGRTVLTGEYEEDAFSFEIPFTDQASIENAVHVWLACRVLNVPSETISAGMKKLEPIAMRLELKKGINNCTIINDSYNSDLASLSIALDFLNQQHQQEKKTLILSDIFQSGRTESDLYHRVSDMIREQNIDQFIGIGDAIYRNAGKFHGNKKFFKSTGEFLKYFSRNHFRNELILLKGARNFEFERISGLLEFQTHETVLKINLNAIVNNLNYYRGMLKPETKIMAMVKAFAYGSGSVELANILEFHHVDYLAVAFADEGVALREEGISLPVMVMSPKPGNMHILTRYSLEPEIYNLKMFRAFVRHLKKTGISSYPIHIKIDTGMHRLGFLPSGIDNLIEEIVNSNEVEVKSVFSHLAGSENPALDDFTLQQIDQLKNVRVKFTTRLSGQPILFHILNSAGIERFPEAQMDMVRLGIGLHGITNQTASPLIPVSTFTSTITQTRTVNPGESIGYGRKEIAASKMKIGVIPVGYADGLNRKLGNRNGSVFINGHRIQIIGDICMDMCMVDITGLDITEGDQVEIFGKNIRIQDLSLALDTIPYEVLTAISGRVKRIYVQE